MQQDNPVNEIVSHLFRQQAGKMTAALINLFGFNNIGIAEDIVQDTFLAACQNWQYEKLPPEPAAWLMLVAKNKAINAIKKNSRIVNLPTSVFAASFETSVFTYVEQVFTEKEISDSQLRLLFLCCHPEIADRNQIIITLKIHCGFSTDEIANAMLMNTEAVKKCLYRTRQEIRQKQLFNHTHYHLLSPQRIAVVHKVLYLMFNEGYKTTEGAELINKDLCYEAMRLCKLLLSLNCEQHITRALMALMFFNIARFPSRLDTNGNIVPLEEQDRSRWDTNFISEGFYYLEQSRKGNVLTKYHIEAAISAAHCMAKQYSETDWEKIIFYYDQLSVIDSNPIIRLNRAIAISYHFGIEKGLEALENINTKGENYLFHAAKADMLFRQKNYFMAAESYKKAAANTKSGSEKKFLDTRIHQCILYINN